MRCRGNCVAADPSGPTATYETGVRFEDEVQHPRTLAPGLGCHAQASMSVHPAHASLLCAWHRSCMPCSSGVARAPRPLRGTLVSRRTGTLRGERDLPSSPRLCALPRRVPSARRRHDTVGRLRATPASPATGGRWTFPSPRWSSPLRRPLRRGHCYDPSRPVALQRCGGRGMSPLSPGPSLRGLITAYHGCQ